MGVFVFIVFSLSVSCLLHVCGILSLIVIFNEDASISALSIEVTVFWL